MKKNPPTVFGSAESNDGQARKERVVTRLELIKMPPETEAQLSAQSMEPISEFGQGLEDFPVGCSLSATDLVQF